MNHHPISPCSRRCQSRRARSAYVLAVLVASLLPAADAPAEQPPAEQPQSLLVVVGAPGEQQYARLFSQWARHWQTAADRGAARFTLVSPADSTDQKTTPKRQLQNWLAHPDRNAAQLNWLVLIGHGADDGHDAKFNLQGPDVSAAELAQWLEPLKRPVVVVNCSSASGRFINALSAPGRVVITATRSGSESNFARFGQYMAQAIADPAADLDKDEQTSLLEAYLTACRRVAEFYEGERRLATEHALLDDNGDARGAPADWFRGLTAVKRPADGASADGIRAHQIHLAPSPREAGIPAEVRARRDAIELAIAALRDEKDSLEPGEYYRRLEGHLLELARLHEQNGLLPQTQ